MVVVFSSTLNSFNSSLTIQVISAEIYKKKKNKQIIVQLQEAFLPIQDINTIHSIGCLLLGFGFLLIHLLR
jgi:molybdopterin synthase catalytic subunit